MTIVDRRRRVADLAFRGRIETDGVTDLLRP